MSIKTNTFTKGADKKHSVVYQCTEPNPIATGVYIMKSALPIPYPQSIKLTLEVVE